MTNFDKIVLVVMIAITIIALGYTLYLVIDYIRFKKENEKEQEKLVLELLDFYLNNRKEDK